MRNLKKFLPSFCKKKRHILFYRYKVRIYQPREATSFRCFRLKNVTATYSTPIDYYTLDGYEKEVVLKNKHVKALIVDTITKTAIYV